MPRVMTIALWTAVALGQALMAEDWMRFRGPNGAGVSDATLPTTWTDKDYRWKSKLPGVGHSSPVLARGKVFVTSGDPKSGQRILSCLNTKDGKLLWSAESDARIYKIHKRNSHATSTPVVDGERVYVAWATPEKLLAEAFDHSGKRVWQADLGPFKSQHGYGVSLILVGDLLIVPSDQDDGGAIIGLEAATGKVRWRTPRGSKNATYSTPCVFQAGQRPAELIFTNWQLGITGLDPLTGKMNWGISVFDTTTQERSIASPVVAGDLVLGTCGFVTGKKHLVAIRPGADGPKEVWRLEKAVSYLPTPLVKGDRVFLCSELGMASCLDLKTGSLIWQERLPANFSASPVCAGQHVYCVSNEGEVFVFEAADKFKLLAKNTLGEPTQSTPAIADGCIFFRTDKHVFCLGGR